MEHLDKNLVDLTSLKFKNIEFTRKNISKNKLETLKLPITEVSFPNWFIYILDDLTSIVGYHLNKDKRGIVLRMPEVISLHVYGNGSFRSYFSGKILMPLKEINNIYCPITWKKIS